MTTIFKFETSSPDTARRIMDLLGASSVAATVTTPVALADAGLPVPQVAAAPPPVAVPTAPSAPPAPPAPPRLVASAAPAPAAPPAPPIPAAPAVPTPPPAPIGTAAPVAPPAPPAPSAPVPSAPPAPPVAQTADAGLTLDQVLAEMSATIQRGIGVPAVRAVNQGLCGSPRAQDLKPEHFASAVQQYRALAA